MKYMYITNDVQIALIAEKCGVDRIWIDLETLGKEERQHNMNTVKSKHSIEDIKKIAPVLSKSELLVRINPWNADSIREINDVIEAGADRIMLPMWKTVDEVRNFINVVDGRVPLVLLLETIEAENILDEILCFDEIDEIHIGLNDLHIAYGKTFMFELLSDGTVEKICEKISQKGIPFGFGGVASIGKGLLLTDKILVEHYRMGSSRVILSRGFCNVNEFESLEDFEQHFFERMEQNRQFENYVLTNYDEKMYENNRLQVCKDVIAIVSNIKGRSN